MNKMSFAAWVLKNNINANDPVEMHQAMKRYQELAKEYEDKIWYVDMAAKYFESPEETWDGWDWGVYEDGAMLEDHSFPTAPWHIFQENPLTGELWAPCEDVPAIICEWGLAGSSVDEKNAFLRDAHIPGYNHGWDEAALEKEQHIKDLRDWGLHAWAEDFYENIAWTYKVLNKYDRTEGLLEWAHSLPKETDPDLEWSEMEQKKASKVCDFEEKIQEMIDTGYFEFEPFSNMLSTYAMGDVRYGTFDNNFNYYSVAYYTHSCRWYIDWAGDEYRFDGYGWEDNKVPSKEIENFAVRNICMKYAEMFGLLK